MKAWRRQAQANPAQILWLQFEDIKSDPFAIIREIAQFLSLSLQLCGPESSTGTDSDNVDILAAVVRASSFDAMKEQAHSNSDIGVVQRHLRKGIHTACPCSLCDSPAVAVGVIGDWRTHFSEALKDEFCVEYHRVLAGSGLEYHLGHREDGTEDFLSAAIS